MAGRESARRNPSLGASATLPDLADEPCGMARASKNAVNSVLISDYQLGNECRDGPHLHSFR